MKAPEFSSGTVEFSSHSRLTVPSVTAYQVLRLHFSKIIISFNIHNYLW